MSHRTELKPLLGAFAVVTLLVILPVLGLLLFVMVAGLFRAL